jgi:hypothetical protein
VVRDEVLWSDPVLVAERASEVVVEQVVPDELVVHGLVAARHEHGVREQLLGYQTDQMASRVLQKLTLVP